MGGGGEDIWVDGEEAGEDGAPERRISELRRRIDGFTPERQKVFLKTLRRTGCVRDAARKAGVSTTTIDRTRRKFPDFDAKCRAEIELAVPQLEAIAYRRATVGAPEKVIRKGKVVQIKVKPSDAMLRLLLAGAAPAKYGRFAGLKRAKAGKTETWRRPRSLDEMRDSILGKFAAIERHKEAHGGYTRGPEGVLVPPGWRMVREEELARLGWTPGEDEAPLPDGGAEE